MSNENSDLHSQKSLASHNSRSNQSQLSSVWSTGSGANDKITKSDSLEQRRKTSTKNLGRRKNGWPLTRSDKCAIVPDENLCFDMSAESPAHDSAIGARLSSHNSTSDSEAVLAFKTPMVNGEYVSSFAATRLLLSHDNWTSMVESCTPHSLRIYVNEIKQILADVAENPSPLSELQNESLSQIIRKRLFARSVQGVNRKRLVIQSTPDSRSPAGRTVDNFSQITTRSSDANALDNIPGSNYELRSTRHKRRSMENASIVTKVTNSSDSKLSSLMEVDDQQASCNNNNRKTDSTSRSSSSSKNFETNSPISSKKQSGSANSSLDKFVKRKTKTHLSPSSDTVNSSSVSVSTVAVMTVPVKDNVRTSEMAVNTRSSTVGQRTALEKDDSPISQTINNVLKLIRGRDLHCAEQHEPDPFSGNPSQRKRLFDDRLGPVLNARSSRSGDGRRKSQQRSLLKTSPTLRDSIPAGYVFDPPHLKMADVTRTRLRSSFFTMKTRSSAFHDLQVGRPSGEEFKRQSPRSIGGESRNINVSKSPTDKRVDLTISLPKSRKKTGTTGLVVTSATSRQAKFVAKVIRRLGQFSIQSTVNKRTGIVVCGAERRTLNVLYGIVRNCDIVSYSWILQSYKRKNWLDIGSFLVRPFARRICNSSNFLSKCGPIFVAPDTRPPFDDIKSLVKLCGGKVTSSCRRCRICIGNTKYEEDAIRVKETWLLDSIVEGQALPFDTYIF